MPAYNGSKVPIIGNCLLTLDHKNNSFKVSFIFVDSDSLPVLRLKTSEHLQLIKRICRTETNSETFFSKFYDCFGETRTLNATHHFEVKDNVKPIVTPVRKVPRALKPKLEIVEKKNEELRICLHPQPLNNAIKHKHFHLPTAEEIFSQMSGPCCFSKLDAFTGFWQLKVDEESSHLLAFGNPLGRYHFKRLPWGIHSASQVPRYLTTHGRSALPTFFVYKVTIIC